jgi:hypothetical protein
MAHNTREVIMFDDYESLKSRVRFFKVISKFVNKF